MAAIGRTAVLAKARGRGQMRFGARGLRLRGGKFMDRRNHLLRVFGIVFGLAAVVGSVVGQGILRSPGIVAQASGSETVLIGLWVLGAVVALISAMPYAELAAAIPNAGGPITYVERAFGRRAGITMALLIIVMYCSTTAMLCFVVGEFLVRLGVGGAVFGPAMLGSAALVLFNLANSIGTMASGGLQVLLSGLKGAVLVGLVVVLFAQPGAAPVASAAPVSAGWFAFGTAMLVIIGTYNGWGDLVVYSEEMTDPGRMVPRALFGGIAGIAALYLLVNLAILHVLPPAELARSEFAAADAAGKVLGARADTIFTMFGVLSVASLTSLGVMTTARLVFAAARDGILPRALAGVDRRGTPMAAMWISSAFAALFLLSGTYLALSATTVSLSQAIFVAVMAAVVALRRREPDLPRPWRAPAFAIVVPLAIAINAALLVVFIVQDPFYALLGFALVAVLAGGYFVFAGKGRRPADAGASEWPSPN